MDRAVKMAFNPTQELQVSVGEAYPNPEGASWLAPAIQMNPPFAIKKTGNICSVEVSHACS